MNTFKNLFSVLLVTFFCSHAYAQTGINNVPVGQIVFYVDDNITPLELDNAAALLNSTVVEYPGVGQNIALVDWYGPFSIDGQNINSIAQIASYLASDNNEPPGNQQLPEIDGGAENHPTNPTYDPNKGVGDPNEIPPNTACYESEYVTTTSMHSLNMGIFDTGTEYLVAQQNGYVFEEVVEINGPVSDGHGHGTHVSTIIDQEFHKYVPQSTLKYVIGNPFNDSGNSTIAEILFDLEDALDSNSLDVVNLSFSYPGEDSSVDPLKLLMESPEASNTLFVVAAGNDGQSLDSPVTYFPAAFDLENIMTVGSYVCDSRNDIVPSSFSNYSDTHVDILAPGQDIVSLNNVGDMVKMTGTSQSTAFVSSAAAVIGSKLPTFDPLTVKCIIMSNAEKHQTLAPLVVSSGILDLNTAISLMQCNGNSVSIPGGREMIEEDNFEVGFYPNPFKNNLNINVELNNDDDIVLQVFDINGKILEELSGEGTEGINEFSINFDEISMQNQYIVRILTSDSAITKRLIRIE